MTSSGLSIERETAAYLAEFASQPPRENQSIDELRAGYKRELIRSSCAPEAGVAWCAFKIPGSSGDIDARLYVPIGASHAAPILLYVHGGGFAVGDLESHDSLVRLISSNATLRILTIDYRRAPEAPFPAARDDVLSAFRWLVANAAELDIDGSRIVLGGESAGAAHALAAALELRAETTPAFAVWLMSPALDATLSGESYATFASGAGRTAGEFAFLWSLYAPDASSRSDPKVSPGLADPVGAPPIFIYTAEFDPARSDGEMFAENARLSGVQVVHRRQAGLIHQFPEITGVSQASRKAVVDASKELADFLARTPSRIPDTILHGESISFQPFSIPGFSGDTRAAFPNADTAKGPFVALLKMAPDAKLKRHFHQRALEVVNVVEGTMINDGVALSPGSFLIHGAGVWHGPHLAGEEGCTLMFIQFPGVGSDDSIFVD